MSATVPVSDRIDRLVQSLAVEVPGMEVAVERYGPKLRVTRLINSEEPAEQVHLMELVGEILVQFGHGLRYEFDPTEQDLEAIEDLVRRLVLDGYEESVRVRRDKVVRSEVVLEIAGRLRRTATRGPLPLWGSARDRLRHRPWI